MSATVPEVLQRSAKKYAKSPALKFKKNGQWLGFSWEDYAWEVLTFARGLAALGLGQGEFVTIIGNNRAEWVIADVAAITAGAVPAGIYATSSPDQCEYIIGHCQATVVFVENHEQLAKILGIRSRLKHLKYIVLMEGDSKEPGVYSWLAVKKSATSFSLDQLNERIKMQKPSDVATLVYTSGTTAHPKAVMLSHENLTWISENCAKHDLLLTHHDVLISYLPLSHVAEQMTTIHGPMATGTCIYFAESLEKLGENLPEVRPTLFLGVPRVWEKIQAKMQARGAKASFLQRKIAAWAKRVGLDHARRLEAGRAPSPWFGIANKLVYSKVRKALGLDRCRLQVTAAAPISRGTLEFFQSLNVPLYELYGMSECTGPATVSQPGEYYLGKVGRAIYGGEVKIAQDGEILIRGKHVFLGYLHNDAETREVIDAEGWLHSGDLGDIDERGFLAITGRKKNLIITSGGENIAPEMLENKLKTIPGIDQAVVVGDQQKYLTSLLTLNWDETQKMLMSIGSPARSVTEACSCKKLHAFIDARIQELNGSVARVQTIKKFSLLPNAFTEETGELTPTLKIKRNVVLKKFAHEIDQMYTAS